MIVRIVTTVATVMLLTAGALPAEPVPAKAALEDAGANALDAVVSRYGESIKEKE